MADKNYLNIDENGKKQEKAAIKSSSGSGDANKILQTDDYGHIDSSFLPATEEVTKTASETLDAGDLVNFWDDAGTPKMRKADASGGKPAHGFVLDSVSSGVDGKAYTEGLITGFSGLTPGAIQFLSESTAGDVTETPVTTSGNILQRVGVAESTTTISFERGEPITRA